MFVLAVLYLFSGNLVTGDRQPTTVRPPLASQPYDTLSSKTPAPHSVALLFNPEGVEHRRGKD